jgi:HlyD family secretion protein
VEDDRVWKWILVLAVLLMGSCVGGGWWLHSSGKLKELEQRFRPGAKPVEVKLETVNKGSLIRTVSAPGQIEPRTRVQVSAQVVAKIMELPFRENQAVKKGDLLVKLDARDLQAALDAVKASMRGEQARLEGAKATLANLTAELGRKRELYSTKDISKAELDQVEAEYLRAVSQVRSSEHQIEIAQANIIRAERDLENSTILSPLDGIVTRVNAEVGELVFVGTMNNAASVIMEVADLNAMLLKARVDESNIAPVEVGQKAKVFINAFPNRTFDGVVERVRPQRQQDRDGTAYFETEILVSIPAGVTLLSGLTANADIEVQTISDVVKVPSQAILDRAIDDLPREVVEQSPNVDRAKKFARVVFTLVDGKARSVPVAVGASDLTNTVILAGLDDNTEIITGPAKALMNLKDGQSLARMSETPAENGKPADAKNIPKPETPATADSTTSEGGPPKPAKPGA